MWFRTKPGTLAQSLLPSRPQPCLLWAHGGATPPCTLLQGITSADETCVQLACPFHTEAFIAGSSFGVLAVLPLGPEQAR